MRVSGTVFRRLTILGIFCCLMAVVFTLMFTVYSKRNIREVSRHISKMEHDLVEQGLRQDNVDTQIAQCMNPGFLQKLIADASLRLTVPRQDQIIIVHRLRDNTGKPYYVALRGDTNLSAENWQLAQTNRQTREQAWQEEE